MSEIPYSFYCNQFLGKYIVQLPGTKLFLVNDFTFTIIINFLVWGKLPVEAFFVYTSMYNPLKLIQPALLQSMCRKIYSATPWPIPGKIHYWPFEYSLRAFAVYYLVGKVLRH